MTSEGSVYTISPRLIMPGGTSEIPQGLTRRFWLTVRTPADARPASTRERSRSVRRRRAAGTIPLEFRVRAGTLDPVDIPAGPFGHAIGIPWFRTIPGPRSSTGRWSRRACGGCASTDSRPSRGMPSITFRDSTRANPILDFNAADRQMKLAKELGFLAVTTYGAGVSGFDAYFIDTGAMTAAGFTDYAAFVRADLLRGPVIMPGRTAGFPCTTTSPTSRSARTRPLRRRTPKPIGGRSPRVRPTSRRPAVSPAATGRTPTSGLSKALHVASWNEHDEASVNAAASGAAETGPFTTAATAGLSAPICTRPRSSIGMKFRIAWHWNAVAGDPYYALDCREDDYAWCNASPDGRLIPSVEFERLREGLDDYRRLITLARLAKEHPGNPAARRPAR